MPLWRWIFRAAGKYDAPRVRRDLQTTAAAFGRAHWKHSSRSTAGRVRVRYDLTVLLKRKTSGSVVCPSCGSLVGVRDERCYTCGRANPGLWGFAPLLRQFGADLAFSSFVIGGSTVLYVLTLLFSGSGLEVSGGGLSFLAPSTPSLLMFGASGSLPVFGLGRWWTVLSASWLHANLLHILFNMLWVRQLGDAVVDLFGTSRTVIIYTVSGACGFLVSSVAGSAITLGASAAIFGLLGALVHYGRKTGSRHVYSQAMSYAVILFVFGFMMRGVDNFAHAGGFAGGYLSSALVKPLARERGDHALGAFVCIAATVAAILASIVLGLPLLRLR